MYRNLRALFTTPTLNALLFLKLLICLLNLKVLLYCIYYCNVYTYKLDYIFLKRIQFEQRLMLKFKMPIYLRNILSVHFHVATFPSAFKIKFYDYLRRLSHPNNKFQPIRNRIFSASVVLFNCISGFIM